MRLQELQMLIYFALFKENVTLAGKSKKTIREVVADATERGDPQRRADCARFWPVLRPNIHPPADRKQKSLVFLSSRYAGTKTHSNEVLDESQCKLCSSSLTMQ